MSVNKLFNELIENSLNPCFNGRYSMRNEQAKRDLLNQLGLNPCFNGRYSMSWTNYGTSIKSKKS